MFADDIRQIKYRKKTISKECLQIALLKVGLLQTVWRQNANCTEPKLESFKDKSNEISGGNAQTQICILKISSKLYK